MAQQLSRQPVSRQWRGVLREYADRLDVTEATPIVTLGEGGTPLLPADALSARTGAKVWVKFEGMNPTGSFKDRGMTMAVSKAAVFWPSTRYGFTELTRATG